MDIVYFLRLQSGLVSLIIVQYYNNNFLHIFTLVLYFPLRIGINPTDNLKLRELRIELEDTAGMKKPQLEREFEELKRGISNVPVLLQGVADTPLQDPLHDIKGHLSNLIEELRATLTGDVKRSVELIVGSILGKETLRGSDYRKGGIVILKTLQELIPSSILITLLGTAVEITELLYSASTKRSPQSVLRNTQCRLYACKAMH